MLRTPTFGIDQDHTLIQYIKETILHWLKTFWEFSLFYGEYIANPNKSNLAIPGKSREKRS